MFLKIEIGENQQYLRMMDKIKAFKKKSLV